MTDIIELLKDIDQIQKREMGKYMLPRYGAEINPATHKLYNWYSFSDIQSGTEVLMFSRNECNPVIEIKYNLADGLLSVNRIY